jgi:(S)-mandelate dehydrogenase
VNGAFRSEGNGLLAKAPARAGVPFTLSTPAQSIIEAVTRREGGDLWLQRYVAEKCLAESLVGGARDEG